MITRKLILCALLLLALPLAVWAGKPLIAHDGAADLPVAGQGRGGWEARCVERHSGIGHGGPVQIRAAE